MRSLAHLKTRAWDEIAVDQKGFMNVETDSGASGALLGALGDSAGVTTPQAPMKDLTHSICQAVFEEYEPDMRKLDLIPDFRNPIAFIATSGSTPSVTYFHKLGRVPRGILILDSTLPCVAYTPAVDKLVWTPFTVTTKLHVIGSGTATGTLVVV